MKNRYILADRTVEPHRYKAFAEWTPDRSRAYPFNLRVAASEHRIELAANGDEHAKRAEIIDQ